MYELYPEYSTIHDNYFFAQDERSPATLPKLTAEEVDEYRNDWFDGLRRIDQERCENMNERINALFCSQQPDYNEECETDDHGDYEEIGDEEKVDDEYEVDEAEVEDSLCSLKEF